MSWAKAATVAARRWVWRVLGVLRAFEARVARRDAGVVEVVLGGLWKDAPHDKARGYKDWPRPGIPDASLI